MAKNHRVLTGCGIGCGAMLLLVSLLITVGYLLIRGSLRAFQSVERSQTALVDQWGEVEDYVPPADGSLDPQRLEAFLAVRRALAPVGQQCGQQVKKLEGRIDTFERGEKATFWEILGTLGKGLNTLPQMADFIRVRNETLMAQDMGLGEYFYYYVLIYYTWLQKPLSDGPGVKMQTNDWGEDWVQVDDAYDSREDVHAARARELRRKARRLVRPMLEAMLEVVNQAPRGRFAKAWQNQLAAEVQALNNDRDRLPWSDGLPASWIPVLEPHRTELDTLYWPMTHPLELMRKNN